MKDSRGYFWGFGMKALLLSICLVALPAGAKIINGTVKVISQNIGVSYNGAAVIPFNGALIAAPIRRASNIVVVESATRRVVLSEAGRHFMVLPVNGTVPVTEDGKWVIILDSQGEKHKFGVLHMEVIQNEAAK